MKGVMMITLMVIGSTAVADDFIQFSDGSTAWRNPSGHIYGKTPSPSFGAGFDDDFGRDMRQPIIDPRSGTVYTPAAGGYINTQTGDFVPGQ